MRVLGYARKERGPCVSSKLTAEMLLNSAMLAYLLKELMRIYKK